MYEGDFSLFYTLVEKTQQALTTHNKPEQQIETPLGHRYIILQNDYFVK